jgi:hypothetical protein
MIACVGKAFTSLPSRKVIMGASLKR